MKTIAYIIKSWFKQEPKYWFWIPEFVDNEEQKEHMIKKYERFVKKNVKIKK